MSQLWEAVKLALDSIWANKLRSLLTLLGNIVAVSSIIAVVALIQGVNGAVSDAIVSDLGADSFTIRRTGIARNQDEVDRQRNNPRITLDEARAVERFGTTIAAVMAQAQQNSTVGYRAEELQSITIQGVTDDYLEFSTFDAERGRMMSPVEVQRNRPVALVGWQVADRLFGPEDPLDKFIKVAGVPFRIVGVSAKKGAFFGNSLDEFVVIPLGRYQKLFGSRQSLALMVKPRDRPGGRPPRTRRASPCGSRGISAPASPTTSPSSPPIRCSASSSRPPPASPPCWSASSRCRCSSAAS